MEQTQQQVIANVRLPQSARDVRTYTESGIDTLILTRFTIDRVDLDAFVNSVGYGSSLHDGMRPFTSDVGVPLEWWNPDAATRVRGGYLTQERRGSEMLLDMSATEHVVVFFKLFDL